jgi:hypothetical protein
VEREEIEEIDSYPEVPTAPEGGWDIRREGRSWSSDEMRLRRELRPEKFEVHQGRMFWCVEHRLAVLGLMLENLGVDAAVRLGDPKVWREAIDALKRSGEAEEQLT